MAFRSLLLGMVLGPNLLESALTSDKPNDLHMLLQGPHGSEFLSQASECSKVFIDKSAVTKSWRYPQLEKAWGKCGQSTHSISLYVVVIKKNGCMYIAKGKGEDYLMGSIKKYHWMDWEYIHAEHVLQKDFVKTIQTSCIRKGCLQKDACIYGC